jgi:hypothetical protein
MNAKNVLVQRELLYSLKGTPGRHRFVIRVGNPYRLDRNTATFVFDEGAAGCKVEFEGNEVSSIDVHGIDLLHALALAVDVDRHLRAMTGKYDFYWPTGEPYFEDS